jgi:hydroxypyruvate reductase
MLACGATIQEINCIRKHLDLVKGGQLARLAAPSRMISLILSDVIGDPLDIIASGPTVPDPSTYRDALEIVKKYKLIKLVPAPVISHLERGASGILPETPKANDPAFNNAHNLIIGNNRKAAEAAVQHGRNEGFHVLLLTNYLQGEAYQVGRIIASIALQLGLTKEPIPRPACIVLGGETTVTLTGRGLGGRNQELALGCVEMLAGLKQVLVISLASDGGDGPTDAAGAVITGETYDTAIKKGMQPAKFQIENDSYNFFNQLSDLIKTGPTQTNVNDLIFIFAY